MKILHILSQRPDSTGSGFYIQNMLRLAREAGHRNYLIAGVPFGNEPELENIDRQSCSFVRFDGGDLDFPIAGMSDVMPYPSSVFSDLSQAQLDAYERVFADRIRAAVQDFSPDIIHSHHLWIVTAVARRVAPAIPMVTSCHSTALRQFGKCVHLRTRVLAPCRAVDRVLALSRDQAAAIAGLYGIDKTRIAIVGGGFNDALFTWQAKPPVPPVHLLYAGKLSFAKGVDWLLRACLQLAGPPLHLHIAGSGTGDEEKACRRLADSLGGRVTVHGGISQQELARLMGACHLFVLPSFFEGLPLVLLEALASGCRIITTDLPGCRELLEKGSRDLVEFIGLPELETIDRPRAEDRGRLEADLIAAIKRMVARVNRSAAPDLSEITALTSNYSWKAVFARVAESYAEVLPEGRFISGPR